MQRFRDFILLYFARKMGKRLNNWLKNKQTYIEI